jgi:hypothetical protein
MWSRRRVRYGTAIFVASLIGVAMGLIRLDSWISHCRREARRCADQALKWDEQAQNCRRLAAVYERQTTKHPQGSADAGQWTRLYFYLAGQADKIAALFREEQSR